MSRKDYILIARVVREYDAGHSAVSPAQRHRLATDFARELRKDNPRFDVERFMNACER